MTAMDPQKALRDVMVLVLKESLTEPMTVEALGCIFGLSYRPMKNHLDSIETLRAGSMYRVPVHLMPPHWLIEFLPILADSCSGQISSTREPLTAINLGHANTNNITRARNKSPPYIG